AFVFFLHCVRRQGGHRKIAVDAAVEGFEAKVGGEAADKGQLDVAVYGLKAGFFAGIFTESDLDRAVDGVRDSRPSDVVHADVTIDVADHEGAGHVADGDMSLVDSADVGVDVARDVQDEIHFHDVAFKVTVLAATVIAIAAERTVAV